MSCQHEYISDTQGKYQGNQDPHATLSICATLFDPLFILASNFYFYVPYLQGSLPKGEIAYLMGSGVTLDTALYEHGYLS